MKISFPVTLTFNPKYDSIWWCDKHNQLTSYTEAAMLAKHINTIMWFESKLISLLHTVSLTSWSQFYLYSCPLQFTTLSSLHCVIELLSLSHRRNILYICFFPLCTWKIWQNYIISGWKKKESTEDKRKLFCGDLWQTNQAKYNRFFCLQFTVLVQYIHEVRKLTLTLYLLLALCCCLLQVFKLFCYLLK